MFAVKFYPFPHNNKNITNYSDLKRALTTMCTMFCALFTTVYVVMSSSKNTQKKASKY